MTATLAELLSADLRPSWKVGPGKYRCVVCGSEAIARERNVTTRYPERTIDTERRIRCMDCGEDADEDGS